MPQTRLTSYGARRATLPDAADDTRIYLIKSTSTLRLTYQIRLVAMLAEEQGKQLVIRVPAACRPSEDLTRFARASAGVVRIERRD